MTVTWPGLLGLLLPVVFIALWVLKRPRRQRRTVPSITPWIQTLHESTSAEQTPQSRIRPSWVCLLLGAALATLAAVDLGREAHPARRYVTVLITGGEMDSHEFENAAAALLGRLDSGDRVRLVYSDTLHLPVPKATWLSPAQAQQTIRGTPLGLTPASRATFAVPDADPQQTFLFAPCDTVRAEPFGATLIPCRSTAPAITCHQVETEPLADGGMSVSLIVRNDGDTPRTIDLSYWSGQTVDDVRRGVVYQWLEPRTLDAGQQVLVSFESAGELAALRMTEPDGRSHTIYVTAASRPVVRVFLAGDLDPMLEHFVNVHPLLERCMTMDEADVLMSQESVPAEWDGPAIAFNVDPATGYPPEGDKVEPQSLVRAQVNGDHAVMQSVDLSAVAIREFRASAASDESLEPLATVSGMPVISADGRSGAPRIYVLFDIASENTNWTADSSFVVFMANAVGWLVETPTSRVAAIAPGEAPIDWVSRWRWVGPGAMKGIHFWPEPGFWTDTSGVVHAVGRVGFSGAQPAQSGVQTAREVPIGPATDRVERQRWGGMLAIVAGGLWLLGWGLASEGR
jgi:hypothetical protein